VLDAMHSWSEIEAVASSTALSADGRAVTAEVTAADGGDVAGTVTFSGAGWSEQVALDGGRASVEVPEGVAEVSASYDGYRDGLVADSEAEAVSVGGAPIEATAVTRCVAGKNVVMVKTTNTGDEAVSVSIETPFGAQSAVSVAAGKSVSKTFSTRQAQIDAGEATVTAGDAVVTAPYAAASCG